MVRNADAERSVSSSLPSPAFRIAFGGRCDKSPVPCNRIDYFSAYVHVADVLLLPATDERGFGATLGYGASMALFHRLEIGIGGVLSAWDGRQEGVQFQNGPALLQFKGILFPLLRNPIPDHDFTFSLQLQQQLRFAHFDGVNDLGLQTPLTVVRAVADRPFWKLGFTVSLGLLVAPGQPTRKTDSEVVAALRFHLPWAWAKRATVSGFAILQGLLGSPETTPFRSGFGLSFHFAWDNGTSLAAGYVAGRGNGMAQSAIAIGGPDYRIGRETKDHSYTRPPIPNRESVPSPWPWIWEKIKKDWAESDLAEEAKRRGEAWLAEDCYLYAEGHYDRPLRKVGKRDKTGQFCELDGKQIPFDKPLKEEGNDLVPIPPAPPFPTPQSPDLAPHKPQNHAVPAPVSAASQATTATDQKPHHPRRLLARKTAPKTAKHEATPQTPEHPVQPKTEPSRPPPNMAYATPTQTPSKPEPQRSVTQSVKEFSAGVVKGVEEESREIYEATQRLPAQLAQTGQEVAEDYHAGRPLRALAPLTALVRRIKNLSVSDVEDAARTTINNVVEFSHLPPEEQGKTVGRLGTGLVVDAAVGILTDGIGTAANLRKAEKAAEAVGHVKGAEKGVKRIRETTSLTTDPRTGKEVGRFIADEKGNVMIEPKGGRTVAFPQPDGVDTHTLYPNGSNYQRLNPQGHPGNPTPHGHGHAEGSGAGRRGQGASLDVDGNEVHPHSAAAHWPLK